MAINVGRLGMVYNGVMDADLRMLRQLTAGAIVRPRAQPVASLEVKPRPSLLDAFLEMRRGRSQDCVPDNDPLAKSGFARWGVPPSIVGTEAPWYIVMAQTLWHQVHSPQPSVNREHAAQIAPEVQ